MTAVVKCKIVEGKTNPPEFAFVFVHSFQARKQIGETLWSGRHYGPAASSPRAVGRDNLAYRIIANDSIDPPNAALLSEWGIEHLTTARNTRDEVVSALELAKGKCVNFVSSPDHLPRVVRDAMAAGGYRSLFASSSVSFSASGPEAVVIKEPEHLRPAYSDNPNLESL